MKSHFRYSKQQRSGIFFLLLLIVLVQGIFFFLLWSTPSNGSSFKLDEESQNKMDSLKMAVSTTPREKQYPFNPNFITDYKGYLLGMSPEEIDRLSVFRKKDKYVNSAAEFQKVTGISDSLLNALSPWFKFPEWVGKPKDALQKVTSFKTEGNISGKRSIRDLNAVSAEDLQTVSGIGEVLSQRIIKFRDRLGGFLVNEQLYDVYGLEPLVAERALARFQVVQPPAVKKININTASAEEIASLIYIKYSAAKNIVAYRQKNGKFKSLDELFNVSEFPVNKIERIALYLSY